MQIMCMQKVETDAVEKQKQLEHSNNNNERLVRVFVDAIEIHTTQTEPITTIIIKD